MLQYELTLEFASPGYIAHPYWPEMARVIDITKNSGMNRAKSAANRRKALEEYLKSVGMTLADYEALEKRSLRPFWIDEETQEIIIPSDKIAAFLVNAASEARAATRACDPNQVRSRIHISDFRTGKNKCDGVWERFVVVSAGTGQKLSNQRGFRRSEFIENFAASGTLSIEEEFVKPDILKRMIEFGGQHVGIGAARKMGYGRFKLTQFEQIS